MSGLPITVILCFPANDGGGRRMHTAKPCIDIVDDLKAKAMKKLDDMGL